MTAVIRYSTPPPQDCEDDEENKDKEYDANEENSGTDAGAKGTTLPISSPRVHVLASGTQFENRILLACRRQSLTPPCPARFFFSGKPRHVFGSFRYLKEPDMRFE